MRPRMLCVFVAEGAVPLPTDRQDHLGARLQAQRHHVHVAVVLVGQARRRRIVEHHLSRAGMSKETSVASCGCSIAHRGPPVHFRLRVCVLRMQSTDDPGGWLWPGT